ARWRAHWAEHGHRYDPDLRLRRGNPYSPSVSLYELDRLPLAPEDRRRLHRELAARTGKLTPFDPHDFVIVQEQRLVAWASLAKAPAEAPGPWGRPGVWGRQPASCPSSLAQDHRCPIAAVVPRERHHQRRGRVPVAERRGRHRHEEWHRRRPEVADPLGRSVD